jgi:hypothetical protein
MEEMEEGRRKGGEFLLHHVHDEWSDELGMMNSESEAWRFDPGEGHLPMEDGQLGHYLCNSG